MSNESVFPLLLLSAVVVFSACFSVKPGAGSTKSSSKRYKTFYVGEEGTQYFIKPLSFEHSERNDELIMDFTFRYKNNLNDTAFLNSSIFSHNIVKNIDSISIENNEYRISSDRIKNLFVEKKDERFVSRNAMKTTLAEIDPLFSDNNWKISVHYNGNSISFTPNNSSRKAIDELEESVFVIFSQ